MKQEPAQERPPPGSGAMGLGGERLRCRGSGVLQSSERAGSSLLGTRRGRKGVTPYYPGLDTLGPRVTNAIPTGKGQGRDNQLVHCLKKPKELKLTGCVGG